MIRRSLIVAMLLFTSSCVPHRVQYYQLSTIAKPVAAPDTGPVMLVGRIATPQALQDGRIRYREGSNEVGAYEYHQAGPTRPESWSKDSLIQVLRATGKSQGGAGSGQGSADGDYAVRGKLAGVFRNWTATALRRVFHSILSCVK